MADWTCVNHLAWFESDCWLSDSYICFGDLKYEAQHSIQDWKMRPKNSKQIILKCWDAEPWYAAKAHEHSLWSMIKNVSISKADDYWDKSAMGLWNRDDRKFELLSPP